MACQVLSRSCGEALPRLLHGPALEADMHLQPLSQPGSMEEESVKVLLHKLTWALCKMNAPNDEPDAESMQWTEGVIRSLLQSVPEQADIERILGKGSQGQVVCCRREGTGYMFARKTMYLTPAQIEQGGPMMGMMEMALSLKTLMNLVKPADQKFLPKCLGMHLSYQGGNGQVGGDGQPSPGTGCITVVMDSELHTCSLHKLATDSLHALTRPDAIKAGCPYTAVVKGTPLGTRQANVPLFYKVYKEVLSGNRVLHRQGVLHNDNKPENVLLDIETHQDAYGNEYHVLVGVILGDVGAGCFMKEDKTTSDARLATNNYQHADKKCKRYDDPGYSAAKFDVREGSAAMFETMFGLDACTQLRSWLVCEGFILVLLGELQPEDLAQRWDCKEATRYWNAVHEIEKQGPMGLAFVDLLRLVAYGWERSDNDSIDYLIQELDKLIAKHKLSDMPAIIEPQSEMCVALYGDTFPICAARLDSFFRSLSDEDLALLAEHHPDVPQHYAAHKTRLAEQQARSEKQASMQRDRELRAMRSQSHVRSSLQSPTVTALLSNPASPVAASLSSDLTTPCKPNVVSPIPSPLLQSIPTQRYDSPPYPLSPIRMTIPGMEVTSAPLIQEQLHVGGVVDGGLLPPAHLPPLMHAPEAQAMTVVSSCGSSSPTHPAATVMSSEMLQFSGSTQHSVCGASSHAAPLTTAASPAEDVDFRAERAAAWLTQTDSAGIPPPSPDPVVNRARRGSVWSKIVNTFMCGCGTLEEEQAGYGIHDPLATPLVPDATPKVRDGKGPSKKWKKLLRTVAKVAPALGFAALLAKRVMSRR